MSPVHSPTSAAPALAPNRSFRVLLIEDHPVTRLGVRALLSACAEFEVAGECADAASVIEAAHAARADLAIVDLSLGRTNGLDVVRALASEPAAPRMLVLSSHPEEVWAEHALSAGAAGYLMKDHAAVRLLEALRTIAAGNIYLSAPMIQRQLEWRRLKRTSGPVFSFQLLSAREHEVLDLIGDGFSTREIAGKLGLSTKTVDTYREKLKQKLNLERGEDLLRHAIEWRRHSRLKSA
jgi:DNA-binding NarL/FixJ family response regulator